MATKIVQEADLHLIPTEIGELVVTCDGKIMINNGAEFKILMDPTAPVVTVSSGEVGGTKYMQIGTILEQSKTVIIPASTTTMDIVFDLPFKSGSVPIIVTGAMDGEPIAFYTDAPAHTGFRVVIQQLTGAGIINYSAKGLAP